LAWAAAESWIASGDLVASTALLRECALQAAAIGEYRVAARTLLRIPRASIGLTSLGGVAEEANAYAEVAGDRALLFTTLSNLLETKRELGAPRAEIQELEFRVVESSLQQGADPNPCVEPLLILLNDDGAAPALRVRAGIRLLTAADLLLDELLAQTTHECLCGIFELLQDQDILRRRAELVFATVFGNLDHAMDLVAALLDEHPEPKLEQATGLARQYAAFALSRIGARDLAGPVLRADYEYMARRHVHSEALYSLILLAENAIADGAMSEAADWLVRAERAVRSEEPGTNYYYSNAAYFSAAANLAIIEGRLEDAEALLGEARKRYPILSSPRLVAMQAALLVRLKLARGKPVDRDPDYLLLQESYRRGGHLGGQDLIVDTLWQATSSRGLHGEADALLAHYLRERRRERTRPEWLLFRSIAANRAAMRSVDHTSNSIPSVDTASRTR
jgi:hypothetical protein